MKVDIVKDITKQIMKQLGDMEKYECLVGVPAEKAERKNDEEPTNAEIGFINEFGSPLKHIPARAHLLPGVQNSAQTVSPFMKAAASAMLDGKDKEAKKALGFAGTEAVKSVWKKITDGPFIPLSLRTIQQRAARTKTTSGTKGAKLALKMIAQGKIPPVDLVKPLIDTGEYKRSISYVVVAKGQREAVGSVS